MSTVHILDRLTQAIDAAAPAPTDPAPPELVAEHQDHAEPAPGELVSAELGYIPGDHDAHDPYTWAGRDPYATTATNPELVDELGNDAELVEGDA